MEPTARNLLKKLLIFGVLVLLLRFVYVVVVHGESCDADDFCFFSTPSSASSSESLSLSAASGAAAVYIRGGESPAEWSSREWREEVRYYSSVFQDLVGEGYLSLATKALSVGSAAGHEVFALKEIGVLDAVGIAKKKSPPLVIAGDTLRLPFGNRTFGFLFSGGGVLEQSKRPADLAGEFARTVVPGGVLVVHTTSTGDLYSLNSLLGLFPSFRIVRSRDMEGPVSPVKEIVLQKQEGDTIPGGGGELGKSCSIPGHKRELVNSAEPLIEEEPLKPWITLKRNVKNVKYLPSMADISFKRRYVYVDVGARSYGSSIGSWFRKQYPKQNGTFDVYAIEADKAFHNEYATKKGITLLPFAAWVCNETLSFEINHDKDEQKSAGGKGRGMGRIRPVSGSLNSEDVHAIQGFDFAEWLKSSVSEMDFVVMKMDVEGTEFDLIPRLIETGAICLIDELFLECHYNRWQRCCPGQRSPKYTNTYGQCLELFSSLRERGVLVHQWF